MALFATPFAVFLIPIVAVVGYFLFRTIEAIAKASVESERHRSDNDLKKTLAQRGMSAAEIERVLAAKPGGSVDDARFTHDSAQPGAPLPPHKNNGTFRTGTHSCT